MTDNELHVTTTSALSLISYRDRKTDCSHLSAYLYVNTLNINFKPMTFWWILFILSILVSVNLIGINICKVLILYEMYNICLQTFTWYVYNKTNVWHKILIPSTLAFFCKVVHEKLWKFVYICASYNEKHQWHFFHADTMNMHNDATACCWSCKIFYIAEIQYSFFVNYHC